MSENSGWKGIVGIGFILVLILWLLQRRWGRAVVAGFFTLFCYLAFSGQGDKPLDHRTPEGATVAVTGWIIFVSVSIAFYIFSLFMEGTARSYIEKENQAEEDRHERHKDKIKDTRQYFLKNIADHKRPAFEKAGTRHREMAYFLYDNNSRIYLPEEWKRSIANERGDTFTHGV